MSDCALKVGAYIMFKSSLKFDSAVAVGLIDGETEKTFHVTWLEANAIIKESDFAKYRMYIWAHVLSQPEAMLRLLTNPVL